MDGNNQHTQQPVPDLNGIVSVTTKAEKKEFLKFPYEHYKDDTFWVPPLYSEQKKLLNPKKNAFFNHGNVALFMAKKNGEWAGRIAAIEDRRFNEHHGTNIGFFGFFDSIHDPYIANLLIRVARDWLLERGYEKMMGPTNPSMMDELGFLVEGFDYYPSLMMPYTKPYYDELMQECGFGKSMDLLAYRVNQKSVARDRMERAGSMIRRKLPGLTIRKINMKDLRNEVQVIRDIYNKAWSRNWGFLPMTEKEFDDLASHLKMIVDPEVVFIAEMEGSPIAFSISLPDLNQVFRSMDGTLFPTGIFKLLLKRKKINALRTLLMGVLPEYQGKGVEALLNQETITKGSANGYFSSEMSWILESNTQMIRVAERLGGFKEKRYRLYEKPIP